MKMKTRPKLGQKLDLDISMDLKGPIIRLLIVLGIFISFFIAVYLSLKKGLTKAVDEISRPLEDRINRLGLAAQNLSSHARKGFTAQETQVDELQKLDGSLGTLFSRINSLESEVAEKKYSEGQLQMAKQVTHALNGTLSAFSIYIDQAKDTDSLDKKFLKGIIEQITSASGELLAPQGLSGGLSPEQKFDINSAVDSLVEQKQLELRRLASKNIEVRFQNKTLAQSLFVSGSKSKFALVLLNLITNSVEAIHEEGQIILSLETDGKIAKISVADNGIGIPKDILPRLMKKGATFGKANGHGIGLFDVKSIIEEFGGQITIASEWNVGTDIKITIPLIEVETENEIVIFKNQEVVIVDDDACVHQSWNILMDKFADQIRLIHLYSDVEFESWIRRNNDDPFASRLYIFDFDLKGQMTGLELIEKHHLMFECYLVTGMANDIHVQNESKRLNVKTISKDVLPSLQLRMEENFFSFHEPRLLEAT